MSDNPKSDNPSITDICAHINFNDASVYDEIDEQKKEHFTDPIPEIKEEETDYSWVYVVIGIVVISAFTFYMTNSM